MRRVSWSCYKAWRCYQCHRLWLLQGVQHFGCSRLSSMEKRVKNACHLRRISGKRAGTTVIYHLHQRHSRGAYPQQVHPSLRRRCPPFTYHRHSCGPCEATWGSSQAAIIGWPLGHAIPSLHRQMLFDAHAHLNIFIYIQLCHCTNLYFLLKIHVEFLHFCLCLQLIACLNWKKAPSDNFP